MKYKFFEKEMDNDKIKFVENDKNEEEDMYDTFDLDAPSQYNVRDVPVEKYHFFYKDNYKGGIKKGIIVYYDKNDPDIDGKTQTLSLFDARVLVDSDIEGYFMYFIPSRNSESFLTKHNPLKLDENDEKKEDVKIDDSGGYPIYYQNYGKGYIVMNDEKDPRREDIKTTVQSFRGRIWLPKRKAWFFTKDNFSDMKERFPGRLLEGDGSTGHYPVAILFGSDKFLIRGMTKDTESALQTLGGEVRPRKNGIAIDMSKQPIIKDNIPSMQFLNLKESDGKESESYKARKSRKEAREKKEERKTPIESCTGLSSEIDLKKAESDIDALCKLFDKNNYIGTNHKFGQCDTLIQCLFLKYSILILDKKIICSEKSVLRAESIINSAIQTQKFDTENLLKYVKEEVVPVISNAKVLRRDAPDIVRPDILRPTVPRPRALPSALGKIKKAVKTRVSPKGSTRVSTKEPRTRKKYEEKYQKKDKPDSSDPAYLFYTTLYRDRPMSVMAVTWLVEHGVYGSEKEKSELMKKYEDLAKSNKVFKFS